MTQIWLPTFMLSAALAGCQDRQTAPTIVELETQQFGGAGPLAPHEASGSSSAWARREWPKACANLHMRFVLGKVPKQGRKCKLVGASGDMPVAEMVAGGLLVASDGEQIPVGWNWHDMQSIDEKLACAADPVSQGKNLYHIIRSEPNRVWRLTSAGRADAVLQDDHIKSACEKMDAYLGLGTGA